MKSILLIEDEDGIRGMLADLLVLRGYSVEGCADGRIGIEAFKQRPFDLIITDILMPIFNGFEVIDAVRRENHAIPIIAMSGLDPSADMLDKVNYVIPKPFSPVQLVDAVQEMLAAA